VIWEINDFRAAVGGVVSTESLENAAQTEGGVETIFRDSAGGVHKHNIGASKVYIFEVPRVSRRSAAERLPPSKNETES
jgi:hypothetical protein